MKKLRFIILSVVTVLGSILSYPLSAADIKTPAITNNLRVGVINFRQCVERSKIGKQEQEQFDKMRRQIETMMDEKEKKLNDLTTKFSDPNYIDSLSPEAEAEAKKEYRNLAQEVAQLQNQYYQTMNQANIKIVQKLAGVVGQAAAVVAKDKNLGIVLSEDSTFFYDQTLSITDAVVKALDTLLANNQLKDISEVPHPSNPLAVQ